MLKEERQKQILSMLKAKGQVLIEDLCKIFNVSTMTIRRDLDELENLGQLVRSHGGALLPNNDILIEIPFFLRLDRNKDKKIQIGAAAAGLLTNGQKIFIGSGSTTHYMVQKIDNSKKLLVVTDALNVAMELSNRSSISLLMAGGDIGTNTLSATGVFAENMLRQFRFERSFIGVTGIDSEGQLYVGSVAQLANYQTVMNNSEHIIILADSDKICHKDFISIGTLSDRCTLITDKAAHQSAVNTYKSLCAQVVLV